MTAVRRVSILSELTAALRRFALALVPTGNLLVITTPPGHANAVARVLDAATLGDVAGTVAGDDTIFIAPHARTLATPCWLWIEGELMLARHADGPVTEGAQQATRLQVIRGSAPGTPRRNRPRTVEDGTMPATVREAILARIDGDDPDGARLLLDGVDAVLSAEARAEWRQRIAWSYYIENDDASALAMANGRADRGRQIISWLS